MHPMNILGIHTGRNCSACMVKDGRVVAAVSEERFARKKNVSGQPEKSINHCIEIAKPDIIVSDSPVKGAKVIDRHQCLANYAYFTSSPQEPALVITADDTGGSYSVWKNGKQTFITKVDNPLSSIYQAVTRLLGMTPFEHDYKVMGLAPYAPQNVSKKPTEILKRLIKVKGDLFSSLPDPYPLLREKLEGCRFDGIAAGVQNLLEDRMGEWVKNLLDIHDAKSLCFSGSLSLNVKLNKKLREIIKVHVPPIGGDDVLAIGAAFCQGGEPLKDAYLGPSYNGDVKLKKVSIDPAQALADGKIIGWFEGRMEFGARALGHRSILADPRDVSVVSKLNNIVKFRDFWMPFTPSILLEDADKYLVDAYESPFMTMAFDSTGYARKNIPAVIHPADYTIRPQIVSSGQFYSLISDFKKKTGIGCLLNTSFNLHGEPIVCSIEDAVETFLRSGLDYLVVDGVVWGK